jgi:FkbM family methyltransferase
MHQGRDNDAWLIVEVVQHDEYRMRSLRLKNINYVVDIGASMGVFAILIKELYPEAKIICVDPNPNTLKLLQKNVSSYATVIHGGIFYGDNPNIEFGDCDFNAQICESRRDSKSNVNIVNLKDLIEPCCDLLKLDCEYGEYGVLEYEDLSKIRYIIGEWHDTNMWNIAIAKFLLKFNYWKYEIVRDHGANGNFLLTNRNMQ